MRVPPVAEQRLEGLAQRSAMYVRFRREGVQHLKISSPADKFHLCLLRTGSDTNGSGVSG